MITYLCLTDVGITLLSFIFVSGIKNKMGLRKFSSTTYNVQRTTYNVQRTTARDTPNESFNNNNSVNKNNEFLHWFSGFTDGEGNFLISIDRSYVKLIFKITLHIDDLKVLQVIQSNLNIGRITVEEARSRCSFIVEDILGINRICSIFNNYPLHTSKKLDFQDFYEALLIRTKEKFISPANLEKILCLKNGMNYKREIFTYNITKSQIIIDPN